jgi:MraZ protein
MFTGTYENSIDSKNRMIIPAKYRNQLGGQCVLSRGFDRCLYIYTMEDWMELAGKLKELRQSDPDMREFIRKLFSQASECTLDSQGRILIPQNLKKYARIDKDLITLGAMDKIEVWSREVFDDNEDENMMDDETFVAKLSEYGL